MQIDLDAALKRAVGMTISRLNAYGKFWLDWCRSGRYQREQKKIGRKNRNKKLVVLTEDGEHVVSPSLTQAARRLGMRP